jgi:Zn-dependent metalloprotease
LPFKTISFLSCCSIIKKLFEKLRFMHPRFTFLVLCCFFITTGFSQILTGGEAQRAFPGATKVRLNEQTNLPKYIEFDESVNMTVNEAIDFLSKNANLGSETTFELIRRNSDPLGFTHHRYQQLINGVPVIAGIYLFHTKDGRVQSMNGEVFQIENNSEQATISKEKAIAVATAPFDGAKYGWETSQGAGRTQTLSEYPNPELTWVPTGLQFNNADFQLAYKMDIYAIHEGHHHRSWVYVDAQSGEIIAEENQVCEIDVPAQASTVNSGVREILTEQLSDTEYRLRQSTYGNGIITLNNLNQTDTDNAVDFTHGDTEWGIEVGVFDRYALDAHFAAERFYVFLEEYFDRNSINEEGLELICYVHHDVNLANAFWNGTASFYGDGGGGSLDQPLTTVDIVAHEFTHGLTGFTAGLIYAYEPGGLNESFSDIFGLATDFYARPEAANWIMGEEATSSGLGIRSALDPKAYGDPANYQGENWNFGAGDNGGVHTNSGVQNHWYYLLSEGGSGVNDNGEAFDVVGIGWEKAIAIAYRNLTTYLTAGSVYNDAAYYGSLSALELFGACSQEYISTVNAWHAVGIGSPISDETVIDFQSQRVFCSAPVDVQFQNFSSNYESVEWNFGDTNTSTSFTPLHTYTSAGTYDVSLTITKCDGSTETITKTDYIVIDDTDPICTAYVMIDSGTVTLKECSGTVLDPGGLDDYPDNVSSTIIIDPPTAAPIIITFQEFSTRGGDIVRIYDGNTLSAPVLAQYSGNNIPAGQMITSSGGAIAIRFTSNDQDTRPGFAFTFSSSESVAAPEAGFTPSSLDPALNTPVIFTDNSLFAGEYFWDFGDTITSTEAAPSHQYTSPGTYTVTQIITNCAGADTLTADITVGVGGILNLNPDSICVTLNAGDQLSTSFVISNTGLGDLYYGLSESTTPWLSLPEQSGEIAPGGNTTINLDFDASDLLADTLYYDIPMQSGDTSQFSLTFPVKLIVLPFPQAHYDVEILNICNGTYQFLDATINPPTSWLWNFGDGNTSTDTLPIHQYEEEGVYDVSLLVCNALGCDSIVQEQIIVVSYCDTLTITDTGYSFFDNCNGLLYDQGGVTDDYNNNSDYTITIAPVGATTVTLTVHSFQLQPGFDFLRVYDGLDVSAPLLNSLTGSLSAGFSITSTGNAMTLHFTSNSALTFDGFELEWTCNGGVLPPGEASFLADQDQDCSNMISFEASPIGTFNYNWDFGDGNSTTTNTSFLTYNYQTAGTYTVSLEVSNAVGSSTFEEMVTITDIPFTLDADISADTVDINEVFTMDAIIDITSASYTWIPQVGDTLSGASESYFYTEMGDYIIYLEVTDADGCMMYVEKPIHVTSTVGSEEIPVIERFQVIPNPSNGQFTLTLGFSETKNADIVLFNTLGQIIHKEALGTIDSINKDLDFNQLPGGIYFLSVITDRGAVGVQRLVIQK